MVNARLVDDLYDRGGVALATLLVLSLVYRWFLHPVFPGVPSLDRLFWVFIGLIAVRVLMLGLPWRFWQRFSVAMRWLIFEAGVLATSLCLALFIVLSHEYLDPERTTMLAVIISGIVAAAVSSLGSSFTIYFSFMAPPMVAVIVTNLLDQRPGWNALELVVIMTANMIAMTVLSFDHSRSRRRSVELALRLEDQAITDDLTGLRNRRFLSLYMQSESARLVREATLILRKGRAKECPCAGLFIVDLDGFKNLNDGFGHGVGDAVLRACAEALTAAQRKSDVIVRWGGDEFVIVALVRGRDDAALLAERFRQLLSSLPIPLPDASTMQLKCSVGFTLYPFFRKSPAVINWEQVLGLADMAMYLAKSEGRNRCIGVFPGEAPWKDTVSTLLGIKGDPQAAEDRGLITLERVAASPKGMKEEMKGEYDSYSGPEEG